MEVVVPITADIHRESHDGMEPDDVQPLGQWKQNATEKFMPGPHDELRLVFDMSELNRGTAISSSCMGAMITIRKSATEAMAEGKTPVVEIKGAPPGVIEQLEITHLDQVFTVLNEEKGA